MKKKKNSILWQMGECELEANSDGGTVVTTISEFFFVMCYVAVRFLLFCYLLTALGSQSPATTLLDDAC